MEILGFSRVKSVMPGHLGPGLFIKCLSFLQKKLCFEQLKIQDSWIQNLRFDPMSKFLIDSEINRPLVVSCQGTSL